jgi:ABC-type dipeptide/oligopeptide/nickel transport system permease component
MRHVRSSLLDSLSEDYIRTAFANGLTSTDVLRNHVVKNALIPLITLAVIQIGTIMRGAIVTESLFSWPGIGRLMVDSISGCDYPVIQSILLFSACKVSGQQSGRGHPLRLGWPPNLV